MTPRVTPPCPADAITRSPTGSPITYQPGDRRSVEALVTGTDIGLVVRAQNLLAVVFVPGPVEVPDAIDDLGA